jgi:hypothetical protein
MDKVKIVGNIIELKSPMLNTVQKAKYEVLKIVTVNSSTFIKAYTVRSLLGFILSCKAEPIKRPIIAPNQ